MLQSSVVKQLVDEVALVLSLENAVGQVITHYPVKNSSADKVMAARTQLLGGVGKLVLKVGAALVAAPKPMRRKSFWIERPETALWRRTRRDN